MKLRSGLRLAGLLLIFHGCSSTAPVPPVVPEAAPVPVAPAAAPQPAGTARVKASTLNLRNEPRGDAGSIATLKKGARVTTLEKSGDWTRVQLPDGRSGWAATRFLTADSKCPADRTFRFLEAPVPMFSDSGPHGTVVVDVTVDKSGKVVSTKVISNSSGDPVLGDRAVQEIRSAKFDPPIRHCNPVSFIYSYRRDY